MKNEPNLLRAHLLDAEPPEPSRRRRLEQEIQALLDDRLSPRGRAGWAVSLAASTLFALAGTVLVAAASVDLPLRLLLAVYAASNLLWAVYALKVLRLRRFDYRAFGQAIGGIIAAPALAITALLFWRAAVVPTLGSILWLFVGVTCVGVDGFWVLHGRITRSAWAAKEDALRLQLLLLEAAGRRNPSSRTKADTAQTEHSGH